LESPPPTLLIPFSVFPASATTARAKRHTLRAAALKIRSTILVLRPDKTPL
jgi:hypothetical protein